MALSEQEQAERLKNWWKKNAAPVAGGVLLGLGAIFGYNWWSETEDKRREAASDLFAELVESVTAESARIAEEKAAAEAAGDDGADGDSDAGDDGADGESAGADAESADGGGENGGGDGADGDSDAGDDGAGGESAGADAENGGGDGADGDSDAGDDGAGGEDAGADAESVDGGDENGDGDGADGDSDAGDDGADGESAGADAENGDGDGADGDSDAGDDGADGESAGAGAESADGGGGNGDVADADDGTPEALAQKLREEYGGLDYAAQAALLVARLAVERGDLAAARGHLRWVADHAAKPATGHAARVRLGRLLLAEGDVDGAAAAATVADEGGFASHYAELRGDIFVARENFTAARAAYQRALAALPLGSAYRDLLELKINNSAEPAQ